MATTSGLGGEPGRPRTGRYGDAVCEFSYREHGRNGTRPGQQQQDCATPRARSERFVTGLTQPRVQRNMPPFANGLEKRSYNRYNRHLRQTPYGKS